MSPPQIAVIGLACRYPGAPSAGALWENVLAKRQQFRRVPDQRLPLSEYYSPDPRAPDRTYGQEMAVMDGFQFDPVAWRVPQSTFEGTDIVHWLTLATVKEALDSAGLELSSMDRDRIGVIIGNTLTGEETRANSMRLRWPYVRRVLYQAAAELGHASDETAALDRVAERLFKSVFPPVTEDTLAGGLSNTIAGRVCNLFDLRGGGYTVDGACSSSLLAVATAAEHIAHGHLEIALAGGVDVSLDPFELVGFAKATALAATDMRVYDQGGEGFIPGEGCGIVVLERLDLARERGHAVLGVLRGWGISSDGRGGITAPSAAGQAQALLRAYQRAGFSPHELDFIEGHGTGTAVGDKVELQGIQRCLEAFGAPEAARVGVSSFKSIVGHTKAAAGVGGLIKAVIAANRRVIPPTAGCTRPNQVFELEATGLYPVLRGRQLPSSRAMRVGVSAMGFGGINCHIALESGDADVEQLRPAVSEARLLASAQATEIFPLTAQDAAELRAQAQRLLERAGGMARAELADLSAEVCAEISGPGRVRAALVVADPGELEAALRRLCADLASGELEDGALRRDVASQLGCGDVPHRLGFVFPGQGSQRLDMAGGLVRRFGWAREAMQSVDAGLSAAAAFVERPLSEWIYAESGEASTRASSWRAALQRTEIAQPAICLASALWLRRLRQLGLEPSVVAGHSLGELTALHAAGALTLDELLRVAAVRGEAMAAPADVAGGMLSLGCSAEVAAALVEGTGCVLANFNAAEQTVASGPRSGLARVVASAARAGVPAQMLPVANAFHSPLVAGAGRSLAAHLGQSRVPTLSGAEVLSCTDGQPIVAGVELSKHLAAQLVAPVDFLAVRRALAARCDLLVEVGPGRVLSGLLEGLRCAPVESRPDRDQDLHWVLAEAWSRGLPVRWQALHDERFVRPFCPASDRSFFTNPCERPFSGVASQATPPSALAFADTPAELPATDEAAGSVRDLLYDEVSSRTGFPRDSLSPEHRLLDDLNLDSIKAGALLAEVTRRLHLPHVPSGLANATLGRLSEVLGEAAPAAEDPEQAWVRDFVQVWRREPAPPVDDRRAVQLLGKDLELSAALASRGRLAPEPESGCELVVVVPSASPKGALRAVARLAELGPGGWAQLAGLTLLTRSGSQGTRALALSVAQELPELPVRSVEVPASWSAARVCDALLRELGAGSGAVRYTDEGVRERPELRLVVPADCASRPPSLQPGDTVLVTGGGKGITAECALALGRELQVKLAIVGRSALEPGGAQTELSASLIRMREQGIELRYYACDVADRGALAAVLRRCEDELGPVRGLLHGAGVNRPRLLREVDAASAWAECRAKVEGLMHLLELLEPTPPRLVIALTSIIGVTGMPRNAWYAFSNELVAELLAEWQAKQVGAQALALAYSVWDRVGMGVKLGSLEWLKQRGVSPVSVEDGVAHFLRWLRSTPPGLEVVVAGRGALDGGPPAAGRFIEQVQRFTPGVELVARPVLSVETDPYLEDHNFQGSLLFPTVMGLEAMAQACVAVLGRSQLGALRVEDLRLDRPIVVERGRGCELELRALVRERLEPGAPEVVDLELRALGGAVHFAARFVLGGPPMLAGTPPQAQPALELLPARDLYGSLLFQGPAFQRLESLRALDGEHCIFEVASSPPEPGRLHVLGDPYARDVLLQVGQLVVSPLRALPVHIERIEIDLSRRPPGAPLCGVLRYLGREGDRLFAAVELFAGDTLVERVVGYQLAVLGEDASLPTAEQLASPDAHDQVRLQRAIRARASRLGQRSPAVALTHHRGLHRLDAAGRHAVELPIFQAALAQLSGAEGLSVTWTPSGKPVVSPMGASTLEVSLSHDDGLCMVVAGEGLQGCDLVHAVEHPLETWRRMLGPGLAQRYEELRARVGDDAAGRLLWAGREAAMKAFDATHVRLAIARYEDSSLLLQADAGGAACHVLVFPIRLTLGGERTVAVLVHPEEAQPVPAPKSAEDTSHQITASLRQKVLFREACNPSGTLRPAALVGDMGKLRELAAEPIFASWVRDFQSGRWGAVTNSVELSIARLPEVGEDRDCVVRVESVGGPLGSTATLGFSWTDAEGAELAVGRMETTWVRLRAGGEAEVAPTPDYYARFLKERAPRTPAALGPLRVHGELGLPELQRGPDSPVLWRRRVSTTLQHGNIVGNVYFANYAEWVAETIDELMVRHVGALLRGRLAELRWVHAKVEHLREAMPFDLLEVRVQLSALNAHSLTLRCSVWRDDTKLASGLVSGRWFERGPDERWQPAALPEALRALGAH